MRTEAIEQVEELKRAFAATGSERVATHIANINYLFALLDEEKAALAAAEQRVAELERERDAMAQALGDHLERYKDRKPVRFETWMLLAFLDMGCCGPATAKGAAITIRELQAEIAAHRAAGTGKDG